LDPVIHTERLTKSYGRSRGIVDLDLDVYPGQLFGFLGPNGAGKTTTIRTLLDFLHPTSGKAYVFGLESTTQSVQIRARLGNLPGEFNLDPKVTGEQLLRHLADLRGVADLSYARELADRLDAELARPIRDLSRGNKQKIGLLQALFHRPSLLVLDEPTSGLDPLVQEQFHAILADVRAEGGTVFLSSHVLSEVEHLCDHVGIIRDGRLVAMETTETLLGRRLRTVTIRFDRPVDAAPFAALAGVTDVRADGDRVSMSLHDGVDQVVKLAAQHYVVDLEIGRPSLEDVFLAYYGGAS
jgi:ABC-2 type transport system ATP-binding protein